VNRIAILGDTGCRINKAKVQACNDVKAWPLHLLNLNVTLQTTITTKILLQT
jgi:hypothetical protein